MQLRQLAVVLNLWLVFAYQLTYVNKSHDEDVSRETTNVTEEYKVKVEPSLHATRSSTSTSSSEVQEMCEKRKFPRVEIRSGSSKYLNE